MRIFFPILKETLSESWLVWSPRSIIFKFGPWIMSIFRFSMSWKKRAIAVWNRSLSRGLGTHVVKIASFIIPAFTGNKMAAKRNLHFDTTSHCFLSWIQWLIMFCRSKYVSQNEEDFMLNWQQIHNLDFVRFFFFFFGKAHLKKK